MKGLLKIDAIMHRVKDLEAATKFYTEVMGLRVGWTDNENKMIGLLFPENNSELVIHTDKTLQNPTYSFSVENVEEFCKTYKEKGHTVVVEPFDVRCGKYAILQDPYGNTLEIIDLTKYGGTPRYDEGVKPPNP